MVPGNYAYFNFILSYLHTTMTNYFKQVFLKAYWNIISKYAHHRALSHTSRTFSQNCLRFWKNRNTKLKLYTLPMNFQFCVEVLLSVNSNLLLSLFCLTSSFLSLLSYSCSVDYFFILKH